MREIDEHLSGFVSVDVAISTGVIFLKNGVELVPEFLFLEGLVMGAGGSVIAASVVVRVVVIFVLLL